MAYINKTCSHPSILFFRSLRCKELELPKTFIANGNAVRLYISNNGFDVEDSTCTLYSMFNNFLAPYKAHEGALKFVTIRKSVLSSINQQ